MQSCLFLGALATTKILWTERFFSNITCAFLHWLVKNTVARWFKALVKPSVSIIVSVDTCNGPQKFIPALPTPSVRIIPILKYSHYCQCRRWCWCRRFVFKTIRRFFGEIMLVDIDLCKIIKNFLWFATLWSTPCKYYTKGTTFFKHCYRSWALAKLFKLFAVVLGNCY